MRVLRVILKILTFPLRLAVVAIALVLRMIFWMLAIIIETAIGALGIFGGIISIVMVLAAIGGTVACVKMVQNGDLTILQSVALIGVTWVGAGALAMAFAFCEMVAEFLEELGEIIWDAALELLMI